MDRRYERNLGAVSEEEMKTLAASKICVIGCGGLGGYVIEYLGRIGVGSITAVDGDVFDETNLNRQLYSTEKLIGTSKAGAAKMRMAEVNSDVKVEVMAEFFTEENADRILTGCGVAVDALDNVEARKILQNACERAGIPLVHGAIAGWTGQVTVCMPGDRLMDELYGDSPEKGDETETGNLPFTAAAVAAAEAAEAVKLTVGKCSELAGKLLTLDLLEQEYEIIEL